MLFAIIIAGIALMVTYHMDATLKAKEAERNEEAIRALIESKDEDEIHSQDDGSGIDPVIRAARKRVHCPTVAPYKNGLHDWVYRNDNKMQCAKCGMLAGDVNTEGGRY